MALHPQQKTERGDILFVSLAQLCQAVLTVLWKTDKLTQAIPNPLSSQKPALRNASQGVAVQPASGLGVADL